MAFKKFLKEQEIRAIDIGQLFEAMAIGELIKDGDTKMSRMRAVRLIKSAAGKLYYGLQVKNPNMKPVEIFHVMTVALDVKEEKAIEDLYTSLDKEARIAIENDFQKRGYAGIKKSPMAFRNKELKDDSRSENILMKKDKK